MKVTCSCGREIERDDSWQRFSLLRHVGSKGGGRQRTLAGQGHEEYMCDRCARVEDHEVKGRPSFEVEQGAMW